MPATRGSPVLIATIAALLLSGVLVWLVVSDTTEQAPGGAEAESVQWGQPAVPPPAAASGPPAAAAGEAVFGQTAGAQHPATAAPEEPENGADDPPPAAGFGPGPRDEKLNDEEGDESEGRDADLAAAAEDSERAPEEQEEEIQCMITGTVLREDRPVAGATVRLFARQADGDYLPADLQPLTTGPEGAFSLPEVSGGIYKLTAFKDEEHALAAVVHCQLDGQRLEADLALQPAAVHVFGTLGDTEGTPLADATILARRDTITRQARRTALPIPLAADGRFDFHLPDSDFQIVADAPGHHSWVRSLPAGETEVEFAIRLTRLSLLRGMVLGPQGPQADVIVHVRTSNENGSGQSGSTLTDAEGRFAKECGPGLAKVFAWDRERWAYTEVPPRRQGSDPPEVVLELEPGRTLTGTVQLENGQLVPLARVSCHSMPTGVGGVLQADGHGHFTYKGLPNDEKIDCWCLDDRRPFAERVVTITADQDHVELLLVPEED